MPRQVPPSHIPRPRLTPPSHVMLHDDPPPRFPRLRRVQWFALGRDLMVTFLGVLLALAANAWWHERQDRAREHSDLEQLLATTRMNETRIALAVSEDSLREGLAIRTPRDFVAPGPAPSLDSVLRWVPAAGGVSDWHPLLGAYAALAQTGELRLIRNRRLSGQIATYAGELEGTASALARAEQIRFGHVGDVYRYRLPLLRRLLLQTTTLRGALERELGIPPAPLRPAH